MKREKTMPEAYIYDHVRTPRGRGKADGALHEVTAVALATVPLKALKVGSVAPLQLRALPGPGSRIAPTRPATTP